jgi:hypothetical protein
LSQERIAFEEMSLDVRTTNTKSTSVGTKEEPRLTNENRRNSPRREAEKSQVGSDTSKI